MAFEPARKHAVEASAPPGGLRVRHIMYAVFWCSVLFAMISSLGWRTVLVFGVILTGACFVVLLVQNQASQREAMLEVLAIAARKRMPLGPGVEAFAAMTSGRFRRRVEALATLLQAGLPLPDAIDRVPGIVSTEGSVLARVGWEAGALPEALSQAVEDGLMMKPIWKDVLFSLMYPAALVLVIELLSGFILYFIAPKYEAIMMDFGIDLPWITAKSIILGRSPITLAFASILAIAALLHLWLMPASYFGWIDWEPKWIDRVFSRRHSSLILRSLAMAVMAGRPLPIALKSLARTYPRAWVRQRLVRVEGFVSNGSDWIEAVRSQGLIREQEAAVLASAGRAGNLAWALRELADGGERRSRYRMKALSEMIYPLVVLALGAVVLVYGIAYFLPLIVVIERLSG